MCPQTRIHVSAYCYIFVRILLYMCPHTAKFFFCIDGVDLKSVLSAFFERIFAFAERIFFCAGGLDLKAALSALRVNVRSDRAYARGIYVCI